MSNLPQKKNQHDDGEFPMKYLYVSIGIVLLFMIFFFAVTHMTRFN